MSGKHTTFIFIFITLNCLDAWYLQIIDIRYDFFFFFFYKSIANAHIIVFKAVSVKQGANYKYR